MKYCLKCGEQLQDDARFCTKCGNMAVQSGEGQQVPGANRSEIKQKTGRGNKPKIIIGALLAIILMAGGFWGWRIHNTEAQVKSKLDLAVKYLSDNEYDKAVLAFNDVIEIDPKEVKAYQGLAKTYTLQEKYDKAKDAYDQGIKAVADDNKQTLQLGLAGMYIDQGEIDEAEKAFKEIMDSSRSCAEAYWGLAMVYQQEGDSDKAGDILKQAVENNPGEYRAYNQLALFQQQNGAEDEALANLAKSLELEINQQEAYTILEDMYGGKWAELQDRASGVSNQTVAAMLELYIAYSAEDYSKAVSIYKAKLSGQTGNQKSQILAAIAMVKAGDKTGADELIKQVLAEKFNDWLLSDIALYYQAAGDNETAKIWAIKAIQANATNLEAVVLLQKLNTDNVKIYAAEYLLYNWKPVMRSKEDLQASALLSIQASGTNVEVTAGFRDSEVKVDTKQDEIVVGENSQIINQVDMNSNNSSSDDSYIKITDITGKWVGTYFANQGETSLTLTVSGDGFDRLSARFDFGPTPGNPSVPRGSYQMSGRYDPTSQILSLKGVQWLVRPSNYEMIDLTGKIDIGSGTYSGSQWQFYLKHQV